MVDPISISPAGPAPEAQRPAGPGNGASGAAFGALLEQLADRARELEKTSAEPVGADELAGAVQEARGSLQDALQLIEAWRASVQQNSPPDRSAERPN